MEYSSNDVSRLTGVTLRQLQWWDERYIVRARRLSWDRLYNEGDLMEILLIRELRLKQLSLKEIRWVLTRLRKGGSDVALAGRRYMIVDPLNRSVFVEEDAKIACEILDMLPGPSILIKIPEIPTAVAPEPPIR